MRLVPRLASLLVALLIGGAMSPARAGLFDDEEARKSIAQLRDQTNSRLEKLEAASHGQLELSNQIEALRAEVAKLQGRIELLTYDLESAQKRQKDFYVDLDNRLRKLESAPAAEAKPPTPTAPEPVNDTRDYEAALNLFKAGKYRDAATAFDTFIGTYGASSFLPSAHYWGGNAYYQMRDYKKASDLYNKVALAWPADPKAADALLGIANCQQESGDPKGSRKTLESLVAKYPSSPAADAARQRLKQKK